MRYKKKKRPQMAWKSNGCDRIYFAATGYILKKWWNWIYNFIEKQIRKEKENE